MSSFGWNLLHFRNRLKKPIKLIIMHWIWKTQHKNAIYNGPLLCPSFYFSIRNFFLVGFCQSTTSLFQRLLKGIPNESKMMENQLTEEMRVCVYVSVWVCLWERVCVSVVCERERECVCECVCVCACARERERERKGAVKFSTFVFHYEKCIDMEIEFPLLFDFTMSNEKECHNWSRIRRER
jgi:hypothetical protein